MKFIKKNLNFLDYKISFRNIYKSDVLILDENISNLFFYNIKSFQIDKKEIFFFILLKSILLNIINNKNDLKFYYYKLLLKIINPKVVICHTESEIILNCKRFCPQAKFISYQLFWWPEKIQHYYKKKIEVLRKVFNNSDYFLIFSKEQKSFLDSIGLKDEKKIIIVGSVKNNEFNHIKRPYEYDILFISQYRHEKKWDYIKNGNLIKDEKFKKSFFRNHKLIIKLLTSYCYLKDKKIQIALASSRKDKKINKKDELQFFNKICDDTFTNDNRSTWELALVSKIIVTHASNIGLELDSSSHKVLFAPINDSETKYLNKMIESNNFPSQKDINIIRELNETELFKKLDILFKQKKKINKRKNKIFYDKNNKILKKLVKTILK